MLLIKKCNTCGTELIGGNRGWAFNPIWFCEKCLTDIQITEQEFELLLKTKKRQRVAKDNNKENNK